MLVQPIAHAPELLQRGGCSGCADRARDARHGSGAPFGTTQSSQCDCVTHTHLGDVQFRIGAHFSAQHSGLPHSYLQTARRCLAHCDDRPPNSGPARPCACSALVRYHRERSHDRPTASATHPDPCAPQEGRNMRAAHQLVQRSSKAGWLPFGTERDEVVVSIDQVQDLQLPRPNGS
jgi:hypothetical protein